MSWRIVNQTPHLLILALNGGKSIHLAPNETSSLLEHSQINGNEKVEKLIARKNIRLVQEEAQEAAPVATPQTHPKTFDSAEKGHTSKLVRGSERKPAPKRERRKK